MSGRDIVKQLRDDAENLSPSGEYWVAKKLIKAADAITALRAQISTLQAALQGAEGDRDALAARLAEAGREWADTLHDLRRAGWRVAVHNDYRFGDEDRTFWLLTHPNGRWVKGEGLSDVEALDIAFRAARSFLTPIEEGK